jgi:hypothetical protein
MFHHIYTPSLIINILQMQNISWLLHFPNVTLAHIGILERSLATHIAAMMLEVILCQSFSECISNLVFCINWEDLYKSLPYMLTKMMIANIDMLCPWA